MTSEHLKKQQTAGGQVADNIRSMIVDGKRSGVQQLPHEAPAEKHNISRVSMRKALLIFEVS